MKRHHWALLALAILFIGFAALGSWQVQRRAWKLALIERVEQRVHAAPVAPPSPSLWPRFVASDHEYRHVRVTGRFRPGSDTFVQAATELGAGFWVVRPLVATDGSTYLINRGFVTAEQRDALQPPVGDVVVTGLLRISEPGGGFLRSNDPAAARWYSRDVAAIAQARGLGPVAPFFIDAEAGGTPDLPVGGLTVVAFRNSHLVYALTWWALAAMTAAGAWILIRHVERDEETGCP